MTVDLACLVANAFWGLLLVLIEIGGKTRLAGPEWNAGNRDASPAFPPWIDRTSRAIGNHKENFPFFLTAVLVVHLTGRADKISGYACMTYVVMRVLHGAFYVGGITKVRSLVFTVGLFATLTVWSRLL